MPDTFADIATLIEEAYERAGADGRSGSELRSAMRSLNLLMTEWANQGINLWTIVEETYQVTPGQQFINLPEDTVDAIDVAFRIDGRDYRLYRIGIGTWSSIVDKTMRARPTQFYIERDLSPRVKLWPVPNESGASVVVSRLRRIEQSTHATEDPDTPFRFVPALVAGLALKLAMKRPQIDQVRISELRLEYTQALNDAQDEDRDKQNFYVRPA